RFGVRLTRHQPSTVVSTIQPTRRRDYQSSFFSWRHINPLSCSICVATDIVAFLLLQSREDDLFFCFFVATISPCLEDRKNLSRKRSHTCFVSACRTRIANYWSEQLNSRVFNCPAGHVVSWLRLRGLYWPSRQKCGLNLLSFPLLSRHEAARIDKRSPIAGV